MTAWRRRASAGVLTVGLALPLVTAAAQQADLFERKVSDIVLHGAGGAPGPRRTAISEGEANAWIATRGAMLLPEGVRSPRVAMNGDGRVTGAAIVDLDAVARQRRTGGLLDPWNYLGGHVPVTVTGVVHSSQGRGRFQLQTAEISGVPVPAAVVSELVAYYSRSAGHPQGIHLNDEFTLPARIRHVEIGRGQVVVVQ